jgi:hypothetical protein
VTTFNRVLWILIGALLTAAGVFGVLSSVGAISVLNRNRELITPSMDEHWRSWGGWATAVTIIVGLVLAILGVLLLRAQFLRRGGSTMANLSRSGTLPGATPDDGVREAGRTRVSASTLNHALTRDLLTDGRVRRAAVRLTGEPSKPNLRVQLAVTPDADISDLRRLVDNAVQRFSMTSGLHPNLAEVEVKVTSGQPERVH